MADGVRRVTKLPLALELHLVARHRARILLINSVVAGTRLHRESDLVAADLAVRDGKIASPAGNRPPGRSTYP